MRTITVELFDDGLRLSNDTLGRAGEKNIVQFAINFDALRYSGLTMATLLYKPRNSPVLAMPSVEIPEGDLVTLVPDWAMAVFGVTQVQLQLTGEGVETRSYIWNMRVERSLINYGDKPTPLQDWLQEVRDVIDDAASLTGFRVIDYFDTYDELVATITTPVPGAAYGVGTAAPYDVYVYGETSGWTNIGPIAVGGGGTGAGDGVIFVPSVSDDGTLSWKNNGDLPNPEPVNIKGADGFSPTISTEQVLGGYRLTIENPGGNYEQIIIRNGTAPTVRVDEIAGGNRVTITGANGPSSFDVMDGKDGTGGGTVEVDATLTQEGMAADAKSVGDKVAQLYDELAKKLNFDPAKQGLPIWYMWGDTAGEDKDNEVTLTYQFGEHSGTLKRKWQGSGSVGLGQELGAILGNPNDGKMNYTIKLDTAFEAKEGWGAQKKYCLKANVADFSHARNIVAARLWGQARANSASPSPMLYKCPNWGAVDGFPVLLVVNDEYRGLYTMNIPKDGWMLNMPHEGATREAIVCAEVGANFTGSVTIGNGKTYEIEYVTDENDAGWVQESLQALWDAVKNFNSQELKARLDIESAIDYLLMVAKCSGGDALARNYILHTTDGIKWAFTVYDADTWFGINWGGVGHLADDGLPTVYDCAEANALMMYLVKNYSDQVVARYNALRETVLSAKNIAEMVLDFEAQIPKAVFDAEVARWPGISTTATNNAAQIIDHIRAREPIIDDEVARLDAPLLPAKANWYNVTASGAAMNTITDINFDPDYKVTGNEEASWDCSLYKNNGIMAYRTGTVVTIKPTNHKHVKLPADSSYMFANDGTNATFSALVSITGTEILTCQPKASMAYACAQCNKLKTPLHIPHGVINCNGMYINTWSLKNPSVIPNGVLYMTGMYNGGSLSTLPQIPGSVTEMNDAFAGNALATNLPRIIPAGVITIQNAFKTCRAASGMIEIKAKNITNYANAFLGACTNSDGIVLVGPSTQLAEIAATNADGKVVVG